MRNVFIIIVAALFSVLLGSCEDEKNNYVDGSIQKNFKISFKGVRARYHYSSGEPTDLAIEYYQNEAEVALRITIHATGGVASGKKYTFPEQGKIGRDDTFGPLPESYTGSVTLDEFSGKDGGTVKGSFESKFVTDGGTEQTLYGAFSTKIEVVNW